jgi:hypothetical protein
MYGDVHFSPARNAKGGRFIPAVSVPGSSYPQPRRLSGLPGCQILMSVSACVGSIGGMPGLCARGHASPRLHALQGPVYPLPELASPPQERLTEEGRCGFSACSPLLFPTSTETSCVCGYVCVHSNYSFTSHRGGGVKKTFAFFLEGKCAAVTPALRSFDWVLWFQSKTFYGIDRKADSHHIPALQE